jgi:hydrogenase 3 maturation protease
VETLTPLTIIERNGSDSLRAEITEVISGKTVLMGLGNSMRGDDGAGPALIKNISGRVSAECLDVGSVPENYLEKIVMLHPQTVLLIDAADFYGTPGEIRLFDIDAVNGDIRSTHTGSLELVASYIGNRIPVRIFIIGIQTVTLQFDAPMSEAVRQSVNTLTTVFCRIFPYA